MVKYTSPNIFTQANDKELFKSKTKNPLICLMHCFSSSNVSSSVSNRRHGAQCEMEVFSTMVI